MNILECCSIFYNTLISECYGKKNRIEINSIVCERENLIPQQTKIEIPVIKRNQSSEPEPTTLSKKNKVHDTQPKIFTFEKANYIVVNQIDDEDEYDIV